MDLRHPDQPLRHRRHVRPCRSCRQHTRLIMTSAIRPWATMCDSSAYNRPGLLRVWWQLQHSQTCAHDVDHEYS